MRNEFLGLGKRRKEERKEIEKRLKKSKTRREGERRGGAIDEHRSRAALEENAEEGRGPRQGLNDDEDVLLCVDAVAWWRREHL